MRRGRESGTKPAKAKAASKAKELPSDEVEAAPAAAMPAEAVEETAAAAPSTVVSTRLCVKNLPKHCTEKRLKEHFEGLAAGTVTDVRVMRTSEGKARQFGFVGFRSEEAAEQARAYFQRSYIDTSRISIEPAIKYGDDDLARPWSRHSKGSSAWDRVHPEEVKAREKAEAKTAKAAAKAARAEARAARKGAAPDPETDPKFAEFLQLMAPKKSKNAMRAWDNDLARAEPDARARAGPGLRVGLLFRFRLRLPVRARLCLHRRRLGRHEGAGSRHVGGGP